MILHKRFITVDEVCGTSEGVYNNASPEKVYVALGPLEAEQWKHLLSKVSWYLLYLLSIFDENEIFMNNYDVIMVKKLNIFKVKYVSII